MDRKEYELDPKKRRQGEHMKNLKPVLFTLLTDLLFFGSLFFYIETDRVDSELVLKERKKLLEIRLKNDFINHESCLQDQCLECMGTHIKIDGNPCIHYLSCSCTKCTPNF
jgi:hypothetical protein